ncbi:MAG: HAD family phosphatase [Saprospiraceae bacterium]|jgi:putative hydrolase of the HAD superfamily|nr:HAD family phosphatase [Saprospiraceae bacterium]MBK8297859.1 HAD family phosphatase [Saprospiraceae bacterium]
MLKNIIFDFGNVLVNLDEQATMEALMAVLDPEKMADFFEMALFPFEKGQISEEAFFNRLQRRSKQILEGEYYYSAWNQMILDFPENRIQMLRKLRSKYRLLLMSNINITHLRYIKRMLQLHDQSPEFETLFDKVYLSFECGMRKPELEFFQFILQQEHLIADECLFIDDRQENIDAAIQLGIHTHLHNPADEIARSIHSIL